MLHIKFVKSNIKEFKIIKFKVTIINIEILYNNTNNRDNMVFRKNK